jgi:glycerol-3-phosphate O-acyltransferase
MKLSSAVSCFVAAAIGVPSAMPGVAAFAPASTGAHLAKGAWNAAAMSQPQAVFMSTKEQADAAATSADAEDTADAPEGSASGILPEFAAARDSVVDSLNAAVETKSMAAMLAHFTNEYFAAASNSFAAGNTEYNPKDAAQRFMKALELGMKHGMGGSKFTFGVTHKALRGKGEPQDNELEDADGNPNEYDFYKFGCDFFRPAMDLENSVVLGQENLAKAVQQIKDGENVVFLANHQSEADPQVFSVLLDTIGLNDEAADVVYVAGHKVTTDALAM